MNKYSTQLFFKAGEIANELTRNHPSAFENVLVEQYTELVVSECARLLEAHGDQLRQFNFPSNALTAESCANILKEHFGLNKETPNEDRL